MKRGNLLKNNGLWKIGAHWIDKYFHSGSWRLRSRFLRSITTCIYVKYARGPVFFVGTISWRRGGETNKKHEDVAAQMSRSSEFRVKIPSSKNWQPSNINPLKYVSISSLSYGNTVAHYVNLRHLVAGWRRGEVVTKRRKWNIKKASLQVRNQVVTQRVIRFQLQK